MASRDLENISWANFHDTGSTLWGGRGKVAKGTSAGRKGRGKVPVTAKELRAARKVVAAEKKAAAQEIRARRAQAKARGKK